MKKLIVFLMLALGMDVSGQEERHVLFIGIDGCRIDALEAANAQTFQFLLLNGITCKDGLTQYPTWSGNGWSSMITGVEHVKHGVVDNSFSFPNYDEYPDFISRAEAYNPDFETISIVHWAPINGYIISGADQEINVDSDELVASSAVFALQNYDPDILFMDFDDVDHAGHEFGFSPDIEEYIASIETTNLYVSEVLEAMEARPNFLDENWLVILTTDHGGTIDGHGGGTIFERNIFTSYFNLGLDPLLIESNELEGNVDLAPHHFAEGVHAVPENTNDFNFGADQDFTIEFWVKAGDVFVEDPTLISNKDWNSGLNEGFVISAQQGQYWKVNVGDGNDRLDIQGGYLEPGQWHHLAVSFDRDGLMSAYEDGVLISRYSMEEIDNIDSGLPLTLNQDGTHTYGYNFNGYYRNIRIWSAALPEEVIRQNAIGTLTESHPYYNQLLANWMCQDGSGNMITDDSPNSNNLNIIGASSWPVGESVVLKMYDYSETTRQVDNAIAALDWLCVPILPEWNLDGRSWLEGCVVGLNDIIDVDFSLYPNPSNGNFIVELPINIGDVRGWKVYNSQGQIVRESADKGLQNFEYFNFSNVLVSGIYTFEIVTGTKNRMMKLIVE